MTELLTRAEYGAIADALDPPRAAFIDGRFRAGSGARTTAVNPATGETISEISACGAADVDLAVGKAREAFDEGRWAKLHPCARKDALIRLCKLMTRDRRDLAVMESLDSGKPIRDCELIDLPEAIHCIRWHAEIADKIYDRTEPAHDGAVSMIVREPIGVVGAVLPWNFPLLMLAWKIGPSLAAGCSVIVKPAEQTALTALRVAELAAEAGVPRGVLQVLPGDGPSVGEPLGRHMNVDMISFTGSTETGRRFLRYAADSNLKKVVLECGGKNPAVVLEDAENLDHVAEHVAHAAFWDAGQNFSVASRLIAHKTVKAALIERIEARLRDWRTVDPLDPTICIGALIDEAIAVANDTAYGLAASVFTASARRAISAARDIRAGTVTVNCYGEGDVSTPIGGYRQSGFGGRDNGVDAHDQFTELKTIWIDLADPADGDAVP